jgi:putative membrane protein
MKHILISTAVSALIICSAGTSAEAKTAKAFIEEGIQGDNTEVMMGKLASEKGASNGVKELGKTLIDDHSKAKEEKIGVAKKIGAKIPDGPNKDAQAEYNKLEKMTGAAFDREFVTHMTMDHQKDIKEFEAEAKANHPETSNLAMMQLPTLRKHLDLAQSLQKDKRADAH